MLIKRLGLRELFVGLEGKNTDMGLGGQWPDFILCVCVCAAEY